MKHKSSNASKHGVWSANRTGLNTSILLWTPVLLWHWKTGWNMPCYDPSTWKSRTFFYFNIFSSGVVTAQPVYSLFRQFISQNGPKVDVNPGIKEKLHLCTRHSGLCSYSYKSSLILHLLLKWMLNIFSHKEAIKTRQKCRYRGADSKEKKTKKSQITPHISL